MYELFSQFSKMNDLTNYTVQNKILILQMSVQNIGPQRLIK